MGKAWSGQHEVETSLQDEISRLRDIIANCDMVSTLFGF